MSIERELLNDWMATTYQEPEVQLAAGPAQTMTDTGPAFTMPGMGKRSQKSEVGQNLPILAADVAAGAGKGLVSGVAGFAGDIESLYQGVKGVITRGGDEGALDAFLKGLAQKTIAPTSEDVSKWLDTNVGPVVPANAGTGAGIQKAREAAAGAGEFAGQLVADPTIAVKATKFATGVLKGFKSVKPKEIPALFSHGTTEKSAQSIMESGKFDPATSNRQYSYSEFGLKASYLTPTEGWWLNSEKAQNGRAIVYDSAVDVKVDPKAKIVRIDSPEELHQLAKKSGFVDAYDMMKSLSVDSIEYAVDAQKATTSSLEEFSSFMKKRYPEFSGNPSDIADHYEEMKKLGQYFNEADNATKQLLDSGVDGIYISDKFSANLGPEDYENWYPAGDQLAMFRQEMLKPVGQRSLKDSPSSTIPTSQQEPK
jgi:hypothetical protein